MKTENLTKRITTRSEECAILLGNGTNNFAEIGCSWLELLKQLHECFLPGTHFKGVAKGITYSEFFDALEISILKHTKNLSLRVLGRLISILAPLFQEKYSMILKTLL